MPRKDRLPRRRDQCGTKLRYRTETLANWALWRSYWRYWRNSGFTEHPDLNFRNVYECPWCEQWHIGRTRRDSESD